MGGNGRGSPSKLLIKHKKVSAQRSRAKNTTAYTDFGSYKDALMKSTAWFADPNNSNSSTLLNSLSPQEYDGISWYTGNGYDDINKALYTKNWDNISDSLKGSITGTEGALNKSALYKGIQVTRQCDFKIFGAKSGEFMSISEVKNFITKNGGGKDHDILENYGFLSAGANNHGAAIDGSGLVIHFKVPPSIGAGAYVNPISQNSGASENEFLFNCHSQFKFDVSSLKESSDGKIHINATWVGKGDKKKKKF